MNTKTQKIVSGVGIPALLEQTAEESLELGIACLKLARKIRNENPTPKPLNDILANLNEEIGDVVNCVNLILEIDLADNNLVDLEMRDKMSRWATRLENMKYLESDEDPELRRVILLMDKIYAKLEKGE